MQYPKTNGPTTMYKNTTENWRSSNTNATKNRGAHVFSGSVGSSCPTSDIRRATLLFAKSVESSKKGNEDGIGTMANISIRSINRWHRCSIKVNQVIMPPITLPNLTASSRIMYQLGNVYSILRCYWNVATYKWKIHTYSKTFTVNF